MIKVVGIGYREWAIKIYEELKKKKINIKIFKNEKIDYKKLDKLRPDYILFYGWSKKVPEQIVKKTNVLCFTHQNFQILRVEVLYKTRSLEM